MTKKKKVPSYDQPTLFDFVKESISYNTNNTPHKGSLDIRREVKLAIAEDLRHAVDDRGRELSWAQVAAGMTDRLGREITLSMLSNWAAPSHPHEMPLSYFPAFIHATGGQRRAAEVISRHCGLFLLPGPEALRAEIQRLEEEMNKLRGEKQKRLFFLKELEGR
jgi:hypothetical protein